MARRKRRHRLLRLGLIVFVLSVVVGLLALPLGLFVWESSLDLTSGPIRSQLDEIEWMRTWSMEILAAFWIFGVGASIGSFLNVVVYRTPRGISFVWRPSHCPYCATPIQARDNIPILGWLLLGGRCRTCRLPISPRYPLVELTIAVWLLALYVVELVSGGANLPFRPPSMVRGALEILVDPQWDLVGLFAYHAFLICALVSWALIAKDGFRVPRGCLIVALIVGLGGPLLWPELHPVPWLLPRPASWREAWPVLGGLPRLDTSLVGMLVGGGLGWLLDRLTRLFRRSSIPRQASLGWGLVGLTLGWQAAISVGVLTGLIALLHRGAGALANALDPGWSDARRARWWFAYTALAVTAQLFCWRLLSEVGWWPGPYSPPLVMVLAAAVGLVLSLAAGSEANETPPARHDNDGANQCAPNGEEESYDNVLIAERPVRLGSTGIPDESTPNAGRPNAGGSAPEGSSGEQACEFPQDTC